MKKLLVTALILMMAVPAFADSLGPYRGVFASWYSVTNTQTTITLPYESRNVYVQNGSAVGLFVDFTGGTILSTKNGVPSLVSASATDPKIIQMDADTDIYLSDFATTSISLFAATTASPVSVTVTY